MVQEVVGVAVVTSSNAARVSLKVLQQHVAKKLHDSKWPQIVVYLDRSVFIPLNSVLHSEICKHNLSAIYRFGALRGQ